MGISDNCFDNDSLFPYAVGSTTSSERTRFYYVDYLVGTGVVACGTSQQANIKTSNTDDDTAIVSLIDDANSQVRWEVEYYSSSYSIERFGHCGFKDASEIYVISFDNLGFLKISVTDGSVIDFAKMRRSGNTLSNYIVLSDNISIVGSRMSFMLKYSDRAHMFSIDMTSTPAIGCVTRRHYIEPFWYSAVHDDGTFTYGAIIGERNND